MFVAIGILYSYLHNIISVNNYNTYTGSCVLLLKSRTNHDCDLFIRGAYCVTVIKYLRWMWRCSASHLNSRMQSGWWASFLSPVFRPITRRSLLGEHINSHTVKYVVRLESMKRLETTWVSRDITAWCLSTLITTSQIVPLNHNLCDTVFCDLHLLWEE